MASKVSPNLKTVIGADTSGFTKGMDNVKRELRAFEKAGASAFSDVAAAIGINTQQMQRLVDVFNGASRSMKSMGTEGTTALNNITTAAKGVAGVIASVGIAAATIAFKQLNAEAENFKTTIAGANIELQTQAYLNTYKQFMHDVNAEQGKAMAEAQSNWKKFWGTFTGRLSTQIGGATGTATGITAMSDMFRVQGESLSAAKETFDQAVDAGKTAERLQGEIYDLQIKQLDASRRWAEQEREIAQLKNEIIDPTNSLVDRQNALNRLQFLATELYNEQYELQSQISAKMDEIDGLAENTIEDTQKSNAEYEKAQAILEKQANLQRSLVRYQKQITSAVAEEAKERQAIADAIAKGVERMQQYATAQIEMFVSPESVQALQDYLSTAIATKPVEVPILLDTSQAEQSMIDLNEVIQQTMVDGIEAIAKSIGTLLGNLVNGEGGIAEFGSDILEMIGTFAQKFGKVLVAYGVAVEAFQKAFVNPLAAIAAGMGLIIAGAAVERMASNMASSMSSAPSSSTYVASSSAGGSADYANRVLQVEVHGVVTADANKLSIVLNNENNRKYYTT